MKPSYLLPLLFYCVFNTFFECNCNTLRQQSGNLATPESLIVGGDTVDIGEYPWIVSVIDTEHVCGGSIVSPTRVVTAGHCLRNRVRQYKIRAGSSNANDGGQVVSVKKYIRHPEYYYSKVHGSETQRVPVNDVAILFLESALQMSDKVSLIGLPKNDDFITEGTNLQVAGWGFISYENHQGISPDFLQAITVQAVEHDRCANIFADLHTIMDSMICAGDESGKNMCYGDSGGALVYNKTLINIVSWGRPCQANPSVYTRVTSFTDWIYDNLNTES